MKIARYISHAPALWVGDVNLGEIHFITWNRKTACESYIIVYNILFARAFVLRVPRVCVPVWPSSSSDVTRMDKNSVPGHCYYMVCECARACVCTRVRMCMCRSGFRWKPVEDFFFLIIIISLHSSVAGAELVITPVVATACTTATPLTVGRCIYTQMQFSYIIYTQEQ